MFRKNLINRQSHTVTNLNIDSITMRNIIIMISVVSACRLPPINQLFLRTNPFIFILLVSRILPIPSIRRSRDEQKAHDSGATFERIKDC